MTRRLKRIGPLQAGKVFGILYACLALIFVPFFLLAAALGAFASHQQAASDAPAGAVMAGMMVGMAIFVPIIYGVMGFLIGVISAAIYNLIARWVGGLEFEIE